MGTGTDVAIESATLTQGDLQGIVKAHTLSRTSNGKHKAEFAASDNEYWGFRLRQAFCIHSLEYCSLPM